MSDVVLWINTTAEVMVRHRGRQAKRTATTEVLDALVEVFPDGRWRLTLEVPGKHMKMSPMQATFWEDPALLWTGILIGVANGNVARVEGLVRDKRVRMESHVISDINNVFHPRSIKCDDDTLYDDTLYTVETVRILEEPQAASNVSDTLVYCPFDIYGDFKVEGQAMAPEDVKKTLELRIQRLILLMLAGQAATKALATDSRLRTFADRLVDMLQTGQKVTAKAITTAILDGLLTRDLAGNFVFRPDLLKVVKFGATVLLQAKDLKLATGITQRTVDDAFECVVNHHRFKNCHGFIPVGYE